MTRTRFPLESRGFTWYDDDRKSGEWAIPAQRMRLHYEGIGDNGMFSRLCFNVARMYSWRFPQGRGVSRLMRFVQANVLPRLPNEHIVVRCADGRRFDVPLHDSATYELVMTGLRDPRETCLVQALVQEGDVVADVGANYGWYTTLMARLVGSSGHVHSFEPVPPTFESLMRNCQVNGVSERVQANKFALGQAESTTTIFVPSRHSGASLRRWGEQEMQEFRCTVISLDDYRRRHAIETIKLIKCDVEGSEMSVLLGAERLLSGDKPPIWLIELNRLKSSLFDYEPVQLLKRLQSFGYVVHKLSWRPLGRPVPMETENDFAHAENVLCSIPDIHGDVGRLCAT